MRILTVVVSVLLAALLLAGAALYFLLENPERFKGQIAEGISGQTGYQVAINGSLSWRYWPPVAIQVEDLALGTPAEDFARIQQLEIDVDLLPVITGQSLIEVNEIMVRGVELTLARDAGGRANWEMPESSEPESPAEPGSSDIRVTSINAVQIEDVSLKYTDAASGSHYQADLSQLTTGVLIEGEPFSTKLEASLKDLATDMAVHVSGTVRLDYLAAREAIGFSGLNLSGTLTSGQPIDFTFEAEGQYHLVSTLLQLDQFNTRYGGVTVTGSGQLRGEDTEFNLSFAMPDTRADALNTLLDTTLPFAQIAVTGSASGNAAQVALAGLTGRFDDTDFTGSLTYRPDEQQVTKSEFRLNEVNLDRYAESTTAPNAAGQAPAFDLEEELIPMAMLQEYTLASVIRVDRVTSGEDVFDQVKIDVENNRQRLAMTVNAGAWDGKVVATLDTLLVPGNSNLRMTLDRLNIQRFTEIDGVTGQLTASSNLAFGGSTVGEIASNITGKTVFSVSEGTLDVRPIKRMARTIDALRGKRSSVSDWPDIMPFSQMTGEHALEYGLREGQLITARVQNLNLTAVGGLDIAQETLDYDVTAMFRKPEAGQFAVSDQLVGIRWPMSCEGRFTDTPADLCFGQEGAITTLVADIIKQDLQRRGKDKLDELLEDKVPDELRDLTKDLLKGIFN